MRDLPSSLAELSKHAVVLDSGGAGIFRWLATFSRYCFCFRIMAKPPHSFLLTELDPVHTNHFRLRITACFFAHPMLRHLARAKYRWVRYDEIPLHAESVFIGGTWHLTTSPASSAELCSAHMPARYSIGRKVTSTMDFVKKRKVTGFPVTFI